MCQTIRDGGLSAAGRRRHAPEHRVLAKLWVTQIYAYIYMLPPPQDLPRSLLRPYPEHIKTRTDMFSIAYYSLSTTT